jgi:hypothetical protein
VKSLFAGIGESSLQDKATDAGQEAENRNLCRLLVPAESRRRRCTMRFNIMGILFFGFATLFIAFGANEVADGEETLGLIAIFLSMAAVYRMFSCLEAPDPDQRRTFKSKKEPA